MLELSMLVLIITVKASIGMVINDFNKAIYLTLVQNDCTLLFRFILLTELISSLTI